jgi:hypothetical protein
VNGRLIQPGRVHDTVLGQLLHHHVHELELFVGAVPPDRVAERLRCRLSVASYERQRTKMASPRFTLRTSDVVTLTTRR